MENLIMDGTTITALTTVSGACFAALTAMGKWVASEFKDCRQKHIECEEARIQTQKENEVRVDKLQSNIAELRERVGSMEGYMQAISEQQPKNNTDDVEETEP